ncbi:heme o synthase [Buchnera aphidicola (Kurisakia onigurumii)]|uniref:heme o synthase n=1 Tax=Buchnera aphidicola TaxID=9 RepID=UPI0031B6C20E
MKNFFKFKKYLNLIKPGIVFGNYFSFLGGFFLASKENINLFLLYISSIGVILIIISGCIFNNIIDSDIDRMITRTKNRVLVKKIITIKSAYIFAFFTGCIGLFLLFYYVNNISFFLGCIGLFFYVIVYSFFMKRNSVHSTLIGSISGSIPVSIGYSSVSNKIDLCFLILFLILVFWQLAHFYSISLFRLNDYKIIKIPIFPIVYGIKCTRICIIISIFLFLLFLFFLYINNFINLFCFFTCFIFGILWLMISFFEFFDFYLRSYSRLIFIFSIFIILIFNLTIIISF